MQACPIPSGGMAREAGSGAAEPLCWRGFMGEVTVLEALKRVTVSAAEV